jgi:hypothetical protein
MTKFKSLWKELHDLKESFQPFKVVMKDGTTYPVGDRWWFAFNERSLVVLPNGGLTKILKFTDVDSVKVVKKRRA